MIAALPPIVAVPASQAAAPYHEVQRAVSLSAPELFALAERARAARQFDDATTLYEALLNDADADVRAEARFRLAMMQADQGRYAAAAAGLRRLLDDQPGAVRAQLELARVLAALGEDIGARRALRQARAGGLPDDVAITVDRFDLALRSRRPIGGSFEVAIAPDSNVNRATRARTLDTAVAPLTLSDDARAQSGVGLRLGGQSFARLPLSERMTLVPRAAALASLYRDTRFNDATATLLFGLEWRPGRERITPALGYGRRWFGGQRYADTATSALDWVHPVGGQAQLQLHGGAGRTRYRLNDLQNGMLFDVSAGWEAAASSTSGWGLTLSGSRQTARDPGYAVVSGSIATLAWHDLGRWTLAATSGASRLEGDQRLFVFADRRKEWLLRAGGAVTARALAIAGFAPVFRLNLERNWSSIGLYSYRRISLDVGVVRAF